MNYLTYFGWPRILEVPEFDMAVTNGDEVRSVFGEGDSFNFGRHFVRSYFDAAPPVPNIDDHIMLGPNRHNVFMIGGKGLLTYNWRKSLSR